MLLAALQEHQVNVRIALESELPPPQASALDGCKVIMNCPQPDELLPIKFKKTL